MIPTRSSSQNHNKKMKPTPTSTTPSPLRRSERNRNVSSSSTSINQHSPVTSRASISKRHVSPKEKKNPDEEKDVEVSLNRKVKKMDARVYRKILTRKKNKDCQKETNNKDADRSTPEDSNVGGGNTDEDLKETSLHCKEVFEDFNLPAEDAKATDMSAESRSSGSVKELSENNNATTGSTVVPSNSSTHETSGIPEKIEEETSQMLAIMGSDSSENLIRKCIVNNKGENLTPFKRKSTVVGKCSDVSATLVNDDNCNLIVDSDPERLETSRPSKRIRGINNVDQPASKSNDEKSCTRNKEEMRDR
ncbi:hypothetical protein TSUD_57430 [Trifolium subterraneum]|uniref:Uncharacterized protein n=1 Tax=Trifolium subterraneum TaxID=3900 RepID=A0A2Z6NM61_TRISU|nr:hypothetical protein TSUD_57430 [Trifolium subterraneum]